MEQLISLKNTAFGLPRAKLGAMGAIALLVLGFVAWIAARPVEPLGILYSGLDPAEGGRIIQKLEELKVSSESRGDGGTVLVPLSQVARLRMQLAAAGLPRQGGEGYELLDQQSPMNMTSFMQRVQSLRALEGELARTIVAMDGVRSARVHIVLPDRENFSRDTPKPTASVSVTMGGSGRLTSSQAAAIRLVIAGAVPRLRQEDVSIVDPSGVVLAAEGEDSIATGRIDEMKTAREHEIERSVTALLEAIVGRGHVRAIASVDLDGTRETSREEKFDPMSQTERSKQTETNIDGTEDGKPVDPVSVGQNVPNQQAGAGAAAAPPAAARNTTSSNHHSETVNYEISSTISERVSEPGELRRQTVAVLLDTPLDASGKPVPRNPEELDRLTELVRNAVGFSDKRGDRISVQDQRFVAEAPVGTEAPSAVEVLAASPLGFAVKAGAGAVLLLGGLGAMLLMRRRGKMRRLAITQQQALAARQALPASPPSDEAMVTLSTMGAPVRQSSILAVNELVDERLDQAVAVVRHWIQKSAVT